MSHSNATSALVVIDAQHSFKLRPYWTAADYAPYIAAQQALINAAQAAGVAVVSIFHQDLSGTAASNAFHPNSGHVRTLDELSYTADAVFYKQRHSALVGTGLEVWLRERGIGRLIISGIRTEQCCETTTRHASDIGFTVDYAMDATLSFAIPAFDGSVYSSAEIKRHTRTVLEGRFARFVAQDQLFIE